MKSVCEDIHEVLTDTEFRKLGHSLQWGVYVKFMEYFPEPDRGVAVGKAAREQFESYYKLDSKTGLYKRRK